eukprot:TRINITY_DN36971_c0_g1_i1.p1 TRINITY_DN36971_c0_g1~~TRINITY_DN36971_c0_g1_i1.p1  ORF type:complete len:200 (-),score=14.65 TRINITY_DN36971_c0_g1_i1:171-770(-)
MSYSLRDSNSSVIATQADGMGLWENRVSITTAVTQEIVHLIRNCSNCVYIDMPWRSIFGHQYGGEVNNLNYSAIPVKSPEYIYPAVFEPPGVQPTRPPVITDPTSTPSTSSDGTDANRASAKRGERILRILVASIAVFCVIGVLVSAVKMYLVHEGRRQRLGIRLPDDDGISTEEPRLYEYDDIPVTSPGQAPRDGRTV